MAEEPEGAHWAGGCFGCGFLLLAWAALLFGISYVEERRFDPGDRCAGRERGRCVRMDTGRVERAGGFLDEVTVSYGDGRWRAVAIMAGTAEPSVGTRVRLEWWDGKLVALVDRHTERRYKTTAWPNRWDEGGVWMLLGLAGVALAIGAWGVLGKGRNG